MPTKKAAATAAQPATKRTVTKRALTKRATAPRRRRHKPDHAAIAERAYYLHLEHGSDDQLDNWLRAERELTAA